MTKTMSTGDYFNAMTPDRPADGCWPWNGTLDRGGYGKIHRTVARPTGKAHRVSWELANGPIPDGLFVLHHMRAKGRAAREFAAPNCKLSDAQALEIRRRHIHGEPQRSLAREYGVSQPLISRIATGEKRHWLKLGATPGGAR